MTADSSPPTSPPSHRRNINTITLANHQPPHLMMSASGASRSISDSVSEELMRKLQAGTSAYEAKKQKEMAIMEFKEMEFLTIDPDKLAKSKANIIRKKQEQVITKYNQE
ncbi:hypothetical protein Tco_1272897 [Tanacetum coccineum]